MTTLATQFPKSNADWRARIVPLHSVVVAQARPTLIVLSLAIACVLLVMIVNLLTAVSARLRRRTAELSLQHALGAGLWRVTRQLGTEALVLASFGGAIGLLLASGLVGAFRRLAPPSLPRAADVVDLLVADPVRDQRRRDRRVRRHHRPRVARATSGRLHQHDWARRRHGIRAAVALPRRRGSRAGAPADRFRWASLASLHPSLEHRSRLQPEQRPDDEDQPAARHGERSTDGVFRARPRAFAIGSLGGDRRSRERSAAGR